jgi:adhesin transport system outer membrane protein
MKKYIGLLILTVQLFANESQVNTQCKIDAKELIIEALNTHPSVMVSKRMIQSAKKGVDSAKWGYFPSPSADYSYKNKEKNSVTLRLEQPLWTGGKLDAVYDRAKAGEFEAYYTLEQKRYNVIQNYLNTLKSYLQAKEKIKAINENMTKYLEIQAMLKRMMKAGVLSNADKNLFDNKMAILKSDLLIEKTKSKVAKIQFEILTSKKIACDIEFNNRKIFNSNIDIDKLVKDLKIQNPNLKIIDAKIKSAIAAIGDSKSKFWPTVSLRAEHKDGALYEDSTDNKEYIAYVNVSFSPGSGLSSVSNLEKSKIDLLKVKFERKEKEKELTDALMANYINHMMIDSKVLMLKNSISTANDIYDSNKRLFLSEKKSWLDLVNSLSEIGRLNIELAEKNIEQNILEYNIALQTGNINLNDFGVNIDL